jgi:hypothetical protein
MHPHLQILGSSVLILVLFEFLIRDLPVFGINSDLQYVLSCNVDHLGHMFAIHCHGIDGATVCRLCIIYQPCDVIYDEWEGIGD